MNDFDRIPELSLEQSLKFPKEISERFYKLKNNELEPLFSYLTIEGIENFENIPIYTSVFKSIELGILNIREIPMEQYLKGFLKGVNGEFKTSFVDSPETRKEIVIKTIYKGTHGFPVTKEITKNGIVKTYENENIYKYGLEVGEIYKAWFIIFQSPLIFKDAFINKKKKRSNPTFASFLTHPKKENLSKILIDEFKESNSVTLAYMIYALKDNIITNEQQKLYEAMKNDFGFTFAKTAIFDKLRNINLQTEQKQITPIENRINTIINNL